MVTRYGKAVMVVEVGGDYTKVQNTYNMLLAVLNKVKAVPNNKGLGVIYWEPEGEKSWSGYQLSCWGSDGKPTKALDAFLVHLAGINNQNKESGIFIYPNPFFGGLLNIDLNGLTGSSVLRIFDNLGRLMKELTLNNQLKASLDLRLRPGMYVVNICNAGREITGKLQVN